MSLSGVQTRNPFSHTAYSNITRCKLRQRYTEIRDKASAYVKMTRVSLHRKTPKLMLRALFFCLNCEIDYTVLIVFCYVD